METIAQEAKRLLESIPEEQWISGAFSDKEYKCCAFGHYSRVCSSNPDDFSIENCSEYFGNLYSFTSAIWDFSKGEFTLPGVNDGATIYQQATPKQRVMALLDDMIAAKY